MRSRLPVRAPEAKDLGVNNVLPAHAIIKHAMTDRLAVGGSIHSYCRPEELSPQTTPTPDMISSQMYSPFQDETEMPEICEGITLSGDIPRY
jgi:hypothetical protein